MADRYQFSYLAGGLAPIWTKALDFHSEADAIDAARKLARAEAEATTSRPLTLLVGLGEDEKSARWIGSWRWAPNERWGL